MDVNELSHHGIRGQKWGVRRFQKEDGTLTTAGKLRKYEQDKQAAVRVLSEKEQLYRSRGDFLEANSARAGRKMLVDKRYALKKTAAAALVSASVGIPLTKFLANKALLITGKDYVSDCIKAAGAGAMIGTTVGTGLASILDKRDIAERYSMK